MWSQLTLPYLIQVDRVALGAHLATELWVVHAGLDAWSHSFDVARVRPEVNRVL